MTDERTHPVNDAEAAFFRQYAWRADRWAIASESDLALDVFAHMASEGAKTYGETVADVERGAFEAYDPTYLARLFRIVIVRPSMESARDTALAALRYAVPKVPKISANLPLRNLLFELLYWAGEFGEARELLDADAEVAESYYRYKAADLSNPFVRSDLARNDEWLKKFNAPFEENGLFPISLIEGSGVPFDRLTTDRTIAVPETTHVGNDEPRSTGDSAPLEPLVTVILTTFNPEPRELKTSVSSILGQTWQNLELLVVDDCSTEVDPNFFASLEKHDSRLRIIRMPMNGGTYLARNAGILAARGDYITGQDTDDWSHPQRIEREVSALLEDEGLAGVTVTANRTDERLVRTAVGFSPQRRCEVSLMFRRSDAIAMGGYLPMRKGADSEFRERLIKHCGSSVVDLPEPLYLTRLSPGSLSRADFRHGWTAPARLAFSSAYRYWHTQSSGAPAPLVERRTIASPFVAPTRISGREQSSFVDLCFVADWRASGPLERAAVDEIRAVVDGGHRIGILQLDSPFNIGVSPRILNPQIQEWVNDGRIVQLMPDEPCHVGLMIVRDPAVIDYARNAQMGINPREVLVVAAGRSGHSPTEWRTYAPRRTEEAVDRLFGARSRWILPIGDDRARFAQQHGVEPLAPPYPLVVDSKYFTRRRRAHGADRLPIVGKLAANHESEWPTADKIKSIYSVDGDLDVRVLGDARGGIRAMGSRKLPSHWIDFRDFNYDAAQFWRTVDVAVQFDSIQGEAGFDRGLLEALAGRTPIVCSLKYAEPLEGNAYGVAETEVRDTVKRLIVDPWEHEAHARRGVKFVSELFPPEAYREFINERLAEPSMREIAS